MCFILTQYEMKDKMTKTKQLIYCILALLIAQTAFAEWKLFSRTQKKENVTVETQHSFNEQVLEIIQEYQRDGTYPYKWINGYSGVSRDLYYQGTQIANANPDSSQSTYCCGLTFEVYIRSLQKLAKKAGIENNINGLSSDDLKDFLQIWFVQNKLGDGPGLALEAYGLGERIEKMQDVQKGDFVQIWRSTGSGHSVIFIDWILNDEGDTTGMTYWSTQPKTNGVNYNTEYFVGTGGTVDKAHTYYSRAYKPEEFK